MKYWKQLRISLIGPLIALFIVIAGPVAAGSDSASGTLTPGDNTMPVVFISTPNCTGQGTFEVRYDAYSFTVDEDGTYSFSLSGPDHISLYLHSSGFNPGNSFPTCLAADNSGSVGFSYPLTANTTYIAVPFDDSFEQSGGSYTLTISGPGDVFLSGSGGGSDIWPGFLDGRLNNYDPWATFVVYCQETSVELYTLNGEAKGTLAYFATEEALDAIDTSAGNVLVNEGAGVRLYKLTTGELQFVGSPDAEGKVYNVIINAFPCEFQQSFFT